MIVYADILIVLNLIVDYLLLKGVSVLIRENPKIWRLVISVLIGAVSSLYIFVPQVSLLFEGVYKIFICIIMSVFAFGYGSMKHFLKSSILLFLITCSYAGCMMAVWYIFKPYGMVVNNGVVYFGISPLVLIGVTVVSYFLFLFLYKIFGRTSKTAAECKIELFADGKQECFCGILDTGNSVEDIFGNSEIIIADKQVLEHLFGEIDVGKNKKLQNRYRVVPCSTVSGSDMLEAFRCDRAKIISGQQEKIINKPVVAVSKTPINDRYMAVLNPKILE
ncbi:MAG: sigma-E processing peptidase SpoIIGA [Clostridia bacterium]|nr:sigma-E processing peptidase SpoIIGA [Clostridia bacterium]